MNNTSTLLRTRAAAALSFALLLSLMLFASGCEEQPTEIEDYENEPLLFAWIEGNVPVDTLTLEWTNNAGSIIDRGVNGIRDAEIILFPVLDDANSTVDTAANPSLVLRFREAENRGGAGVYEATTDDYRPNPLWTYRIEARKPSEGVNLWAETTVPDTFSYYAARQDNPDLPVTLDGDTLTRDEEEIYMVWTESATARGFVLGIIAQTPRDQAIPLDPEWDPNDPDDEIEPEEVNRHNWTFTRYDQRAMTVAWIFFQWSGWNELYINAASESYYEYMFSLINRSDPSYTENPAWNVNGGIGVFGAYSQHRFSIFLERAEE